MIVIFTDAAEADLEQIGDYIALDSPARAYSFIQELRVAAKNLGEYPKSHPLVPRYESTGMRRRSYGSYLIFYALRPDRVVVVRILNSAQDYEAMLFPES